MQKYLSPNRLILEVYPGFLVLSIFFRCVSIMFTPAPIPIMNSPLPQTRAPSHSTLA